MLLKAMSYPQVKETEPATAAEPLVVSVQPSPCLIYHSHCHTSPTWSEMPSYQRFPIHTHTHTHCSFALAWDTHKKEPQITGIKIWDIHELCLTAPDPAKDPIQCWPHLMSSWGQCQHRGTLRQCSRTTQPSPGASLQHPWGQPAAQGKGLCCDHHAWERPQALHRPQEIWSKPAEASKHAQLSNCI